MTQYGGRNDPKWGQNDQKWGQKVTKNGPKMTKNGPKMGQNQFLKNPEKGAQKVGQKTLSIECLKMPFKNDPILSHFLTTFFHGFFSFVKK